MKLLIISLFAFLLISVPLVSAQGIVEMAGNVASNMLFAFKKYVVWGVTDFYLRYLNRNTVALENFLRITEKEDALQAAYNQQYQNPECCTPAECLIDRTRVCPMVCEDCSKVIDDINAHFG